MNSPEWSKKCFTIMTNELVPRAKNLGISLNEFCDPNAINALVRLEFDGIITRKTLREILDERVKIIQNDKLRTDKMEEPTVNRQ
jgi:hypothetical protein